MSERVGKDAGGLKIRCYFVFWDLFRRWFRYYILAVSRHGGYENTLRGSIAEQLAGPNVVRSDSIHNNAGILNFDTGEW